MRVMTVNSPSRQMGYNLAAITVFAALAGVAMAYGIDALTRASKAAAPDTAAVELSLGGQDLVIPHAWYLRDDGTGNGFATRLDLSLPFDFDGATTPVGVTLLPLSRARPSATLLDQVYLHLFGVGEIQGPIGLVGKPLKPDAGYEGETVWYDPLAVRPFAAKCSEPVLEAEPSQCLRVVAVARGLGAMVSFPATMLDHWRDFDGKLGALLAEMGLERS